MRARGRPGTGGDATRGMSRRAFGRALTLAAAGAALRFHGEAALARAQLSDAGPLPRGAVKINANENPLGPCPEAAEAVRKVAALGGRYMYEATEEFVETFAARAGLGPECVLPYAGSSDPLHRAVIAFTSPSRSFVVADPGYEAGARAASFMGAPVRNVPLAKDHSHDVRAMVAADPQAGVIYICNPNNPTGTLTPRSEIEYALAHKPKGSIVLLDEAYIHFSDAPSCADLAAAGKDLIVLRTFSKLYGMAGLRAGVAVGRPDLLGKLERYGTGPLPVTGMAAATASLNVRTLVAERRRINREVRSEVFDFLRKHNVGFVPSESNCFMLDARRPAGEFVAAMARERVFVGRVWPAWPNHSRITVGTREEMEKFKAALLRVMR